ISYCGYTSIERKLRMLQLQGIKGEAVIIYCDPLITQKMGHYQLSRRVNKMKIKMVCIPHI
ncbi:MAG: hypothetical protein MUP22_15155, partial [Desulfobacterales bacterium]|nr:hypothetical protein [Desulfobacterales bacterium]